MILQQCVSRNCSSPIIHDPFHWTHLFGLSWLVRGGGGIQLGTFIMSAMLCDVFRFSLYMLYIYIYVYISEKENIFFWKKQGDNWQKQGSSDQLQPNEFWHTKNNYKETRENFGPWTFKGFWVEKNYTGVDPSWGRFQIVPKNVSPFVHISHGLSPLLAPKRTKKDKRAHFETHWETPTIVTKINSGRKKIPRNMFS